MQPAFDPQQEVIHGPWSRPDHQADLTPGRETSPDVSRELARRMFSEAFREPKLTLDDLHTQRVVVCWRVLRRWAQVLGLPAAHGSIVSLWQACHPFRPLLPGDVSDADSDWKTPKSVIRLVEEWRADPIPVMPVMEAQDEARRAVCADRLARVFQVIGGWMGIPEGASDNLTLGKYGLRHLAIADTVLQSLPQPPEIVAWEHMVVETVMEMLPTKATWGCVKWLRAKFGMSDSESQFFIDTARELAVRMTQASEEQQRAIASMRLERIFDRSENVDPRVAIAAAKTLAQIQGLTRDRGGGDDMEDWEDALQEATAEVQDQKMRELGLDD